MNLFLIKLCWKNIWRNKRRTLITVNAIGFGVMALVALYNYYDAFHEQVIHNVIRYHSGHLLVSAPGYLARSSPNRYIKNPDPALRWLAKREEIKAYSPRVLIQGLLSSPRGSANILFTGIDPQRERRVTQFASNIVSGSYFAGRTRGKPIVIGMELSRLLKLRINSKVVALTQGVDGSIGNELFYVAGIFETHSDVDKHLAFILSEDARVLLSLPSNAIHQISIMLGKEGALKAVQSDFAKTFQKNYAYMLTWMQIQRPLMGMIELNRGANRLLMIIIMIIAALGITNSILMSILERTREFGVMMAIGTKTSEVVSMVVTETLLLSLVGVIIGNFFGITLTLYFNHRGFDLKWLTNQTLAVEGTILQTVSYPTVVWENSLLVTSVILVLSLFVSIIPVRHILKLRVVEALRSH